MIPWNELFRPDAHPAELVARSTLVYWFLFILFRFILRRDVGRLGIADVLFVVLIADAAQNAMIGDALSVTDGVVVISTLAGWNFLLDWASSRFAWLHRVIEMEPRLLIRNGHVVSENLRREMITFDELLAKLRENGVERLAEVKLAMLEGDGEISVIRRGARDSPPPKRSRDV